MLNNETIARVSGEAQARHLYKHTVVFLDREDEYHLASGTLVQIENRLFIATAAHAVHPSPSGRLWLVGRHMKQESKGFPGFIAWGKSADGWPDVGYLELDASVAIPYLGIEPCSLRSLEDVGVGREGRGAVILGAPSQELKLARVTLESGSIGGIIRSQCDAFFNVPLMPREWPVVRDCDPLPNDRVDMFFEWSEDFPDAPGLSGGGIWDQGFDINQMWSPESAKLIAIQSSWKKDQNYIWAVQIHHWIRLIARDYPSLSGVLKAQFPDLDVCGAATGDPG